MSAPRLTFFCELETEPLQALLDARLIADLAAMKANLSLGIIDLSPERAEVVQRLNRAGVPVIAWLLLPKDQGYWFNLDNAPQAAIRYADFIAWTSEHGLHWAGIGLDIEPDIREITQFAQGKWRMLPRVFWRLVDIPRMKRARAAYIELVAQIHADGYPVDGYQFPVIADERQARSTLLQRAAGLVDLPVDREVWMLYTSFVRPNGAGLLASYTPEAQSVGLGSTGGGVDADFGNFKPLTWDEMARDLRLAWHWSDDLHIFSLEGCVQQGFMERLKNFVWDYPILLPDESLARVNNWRGALRSILWIGAHLTAFMLLIGAVLVGWKWVKRYLSGNRR
jgi:hypothetical protein